MMKLVHLQPFIPHYREEFFSLLGRRLKEKNVGQSFEQEIYTFERTKDVKSASFNMSNISCKHIQSMLIKNKLLVYNPFKLLRKENEVLVLMLHFAHISTWLLLLTKRLHHKKIILWGQGISVRRYLKEEKKPDWKLKWMMALADGVWLYMEKEKEQWQTLFPQKPMVALNNTLTGVDEMVNYKPELNKEDLKKKYDIQEEIVFIFCARFTADRRIDLLSKERVLQNPIFLHSKMSTTLELFTILPLNANCLHWLTFISNLDGLDCLSLKLWRMVNRSSLLNVALRLYNALNIRI